jgi:hypothetical protein
MKEASSCNYNIDKKKEEEHDTEIIKESSNKMKCRTMTVVRKD